MSVKKGRKICRHCGGALIDRIEEVICIMCGRPEGHSCGACQFMDGERTGSGKGKKPRAA